ncbi:hypothetical protein C8Q76DRAFT_690713 [Earliella scabrosa]|nr:hypothetical protein C8Q76DRAFT_690713 [Earliella scabrosa]
MSSWHTAPYAPCQTPVHVRLQHYCSSSGRLFTALDSASEVTDELEDPTNPLTFTAPPALGAAIRQIQRAQVRLDKRMQELETQLASMRAAFATSLESSKSLLLKTQKTITSERRSMERTQVGSATTMETFGRTLAKTQRAVATLQAKHTADASLMESLANDIAEVLSIQEEMGGRLKRLEESESAIRLETGQTRELIAELKIDDKPVALPTINPTLADELAIPQSQVQPLLTSIRVAVDLGFEHGIAKVYEHAERLTAHAGSVAHFVTAAYLWYGPVYVSVATSLVVFMFSSVWLFSSRTLSSSPLHSASSIWDDL